MNHINLYVHFYFSIGGVCSHLTYYVCAVFPNSNIRDMMGNILKFEIPLFDEKINLTTLSSTIQDLLVQQGLNQALEDEKPTSMSISDWNIIQRKVASSICLALAR